MQWLEFTGVSIRTVTVRRTAYRVARSLREVCMNSDTSFIITLSPECDIKNFEDYDIEAQTVCKLIICNTAFEDIP